MLNQTSPYFYGIESLETRAEREAFQDELHSLVNTQVEVLRSAAFIKPTQRELEEYESRRDRIRDLLRNLTGRRRKN